MRKDQFLDLRGILLTSLVQIIIFFSTFTLTFFTTRCFKTGLLGACFLFFIYLTGVTLIALKVIRSVAPMQEGSHPYEQRSATCYTWNLYGFLCITNLGLFYNSDFLPPPFRNFFYALLGGKFGKGLISIGGRIADAHLVRIEEDVIIGDGSIISGHVLSNFPSKTLILGKVYIKRNAMIGARTVILPGVIIGENSMVNAISLVTMNTQIPDNEIWGGIPARKIKSFSSPKA